MRTGSFALSSLACAASLLAADAALACGGLFCSSVQSTPVDQTGELILFEVSDDGTVTATVEIQYTGDPREFSWIVPVPETPTDMGVASASTLRLLDLATRPSFTPPTTFCSTPSSGGFPLGASCSESLAARDADFVAVPGEGGGEVNVEELPRVGPFDGIVVVDSADPDALVQWLTDNEYLVTDPMKPIIAQYASEGQKFLAMKLAPDAGVADIVPLRFTCPAESPHIPLRLTGLAAVPEMGIGVFIAGDARYAPLNYREIEIPTDDVRWDPRTNQFNYYALSSHRLDEEGGLAFVTERAQASDAVLASVQGVFLGAADEEAARLELDSLLRRRPFLTRLYTRMNPEEMFEDPVFERSGGGSVDGVHDLSDRRVDLCEQAPPRVCGDVYCGQGAECADTDLGAGCVCPAGHVARRISTAGRDTVTCQTADTDYLSSILQGDADPCAGVDCGSGRCVAVNGAATCACDAGLAAALDPQRPRGVVCTAARARFSPDELLWPEPLERPSSTRFASDEGSCMSASKEPFTGLSFLAFAFAAVCGFSRILRRRG